MSNFTWVAEAKEELIRYKKKLPKPEEFKTYQKYHNENVDLIEFGLKNVQDILNDLYVKEFLTKNKFKFKFTTNLMKFLDKENIIGKTKLKNFKKLKSNEYNESEFKRIFNNLDKQSKNIQDSIIKLAKVNQEYDSVKKEINVFTNILLGLLISWCDEVIKRLFFEPNAFKYEQVDKLHEIKSLEEKWKIVLKVSFCKAYNISSQELLYEDIDIKENTIIDKASKLLYENFSEIMETFLTPAIKIRNKVQHGEWIYAFEGPYSKRFSEELTKSLKNENVKTVQIKIKLFKLFYSLLLDITTRQTHYSKIDSKGKPFIFEQFNQFSEKFNKIKKELENIDFNKYQKMLVDKHLKGERIKRNLKKINS